MKNLAQTLFVSYIVKVLTIILLSLSIFSLFVSSQVKSSNSIEISSLKKEYPNEDAIILTSKTEIRFTKDKQGNVVAKEKDVNMIMGLKLNVSYPKMYFYNNYSHITSTKYSTEKRKCKIIPVCENFEQDGIFHSDVKACQYSMQFVNVGEIKTLEVNKEYDDLKYLNRISLIEDFPIKEKQFIVYVPVWLDIEILEFSFDGYDVEKTEEKIYEGKQVLNQITYTIKRLPSFTSENNSLNNSYYYPHLLTLCKRIHTPNNQELLADISARYNWYHKLIKELRPQKEVIQQKVNEIVSDTDSKQQKVEKLFYWVQDNIRYLAYEEGIAAFKPDEAHNVLSKRYGDCKGMANLLKEMLLCVGIDARFSWIGTNSVYYDFDLPSLSIENHAICTVYLDNKTFYLDPTESFIPIGENAERILGRKLLIENNDSFVVSTVICDSICNKVYRYYQLSIQDEMLEGTATAEFNGEEKRDLYRWLRLQKETSKHLNLKLIIKNANTNVGVNTVSSENLFNRKEPFTINASIQIKGCVSTFDNQIYLDVDPVKTFSSLNITENRKSDLYLGNKINKVTEVQIATPEGYKISHIPDPIKIKESNLVFNTSYELKNSILTYKCFVQTGTNTIYPELFKEWRTYLEQISKNYNNQIIYTKK